jgi:hypothetical protein
MRIVIIGLGWDHKAGAIDMLIPEEAPHGS